MNLEKPDFNSFESTINALFSRARGHIEPGAHRMQRLLSQELLLHLSRVPTILVGGTNGKGSMCAILERVLRDAGYKTGLYTSPHLISPTERIRIQGKPVHKEVFLKYARRAFERAQQSLPDATFFELMTALAFEIFCDESLDFFVCEVGLGGRLDSTNILSPSVSVLTSVGLDHTEWLGETEDLIAYEKSFISRRNRPFVIAPVTAAAKEGISKALSRTGAQPIYACVDDVENSKKESDIQTLKICSIVLRQLEHTHNLKISENQLQQSARNTFWPGRFDLRWIENIPVLFDAAHNSHGVRFFLQKCAQTPNLSQLPRPWTLIYASLADKDWRSCLSLLNSAASEIILTQTKNPRAVPANVMLEYFNTLKAESSCSAIVESIDAIHSALAKTKAQRGTLVILGSITLIGEIMECLNLPVFTEFELTN